MRFLIILVAGVAFGSATDSPSPIATAVLRSLRADTSALAHIQVDSVRPALVIERPYENSGWQFGFLFHWPRISKSTRCQWRGLPRDSIEHLVHVMARVDSSVLARGHAAETRLRQNRRPQLVVFVSPEFRGMHLVAVFSFYPEREARGGRVTNYASFNQGLEYVTCGTGDTLELLGPSRVTYD